MGQRKTSIKNQKNKKLLNWAKSDLENLLYIIVDTNEKRFINKDGYIVEDGSPDIYSEIIFRKRYLAKDFNDCEIIFKRESKFYNKRIYPIDEFARQLRKTLDYKFKQCLLATGRRREKIDQNLLKSFKILKEYLSQKSEKQGYSLVEIWDEKQVKKYDLLMDKLRDHHSKFDAPIITSNVDTKPNWKVKGKYLIGLWKFLTNNNLVPNNKYSGAKIASIFKNTFIINIKLDGKYFEPEVLSSAKNKKFEDFFNSHLKDLKFD